MNVHIQLVSFLTFFIFGFLLMLTYEIFLRKRSYLCYLFFPMLTIVFMSVLYHINDGKVHTYFVGTFILGIIISKICVKFLKTKFKLLKTKKA